MRRHFGDGLRQLRAFGAVYLSLTRKIVAYTPRVRLVIGVVLDLLGVAANGGLLAAITFYVALQTRPAGGDPLAEWVHTNQIDALSVFTGGFLCLALVAAGAAYGSALMFRRGARELQTRLVQEACIALTGVDRLRADATRSAPIRLHLHLLRNPLQSAIAMETLTGMIRPIGMVTVAFVALAFLAPWVGAALLIGGAFVIPPLYLISRLTTRTAGDFFENRLLANAGAMRRMTLQIDSSTLTPPSREDAVALTADEPFQRYLDGVDTNQLASEYMTVTIGMFRAVAAGVCIYVAGWLVISGVWDWASFVPIVGALLLVINGARDLLARLATLNKFYPQIRSFTRLLDEADVEPRPLLMDWPVEISLPVGPSPIMAGHPGQVTLGPVAPVFVVGGPKASRHALPSMRAPFKHARPDLTMFWDRAALLTAAAQAPRDAAIEETRKHHVRGLLRTLGCAADLLDRDRGRFSPQDHTSLLYTLFLADENYHSLFVDRKAFETVSDLLRSADNVPLHYLFVFNAPTASDENLWPAAHVIVVENDVIVDAGDLDWWRQTKNARTLKASSANAGTMDDSDAMLNEIL